MGVVVSYFSDESVINTDEKQNNNIHKPKFYKNLDGPAFVALDYNKIYATRHYLKATWVSTIENCPSLEIAWKKGKSCLDKYFGGQNQRNYKLPKTCPLILKYSLNDDGNNRRIASSLPLPKYFSDEPPGPQNREVFIYHEKKRIFYTGYFHKQFNEDDIEYNITILKNKMKENNETFNEDYCHIAFYDVQHKSLNRMQYFEIWFEGKTEDDDYMCLQNCEDEQEENE